MNKLLPLFFLFSLTLRSQYTLTSAFNACGVGDSYTEQFVGTTGFTVLPGGSNVVWNYSGIALTSNTRVVNYVSPSSTPKSSLYPGATVVRTYTDASATTIYENYKYTSTTAEFMGSYGSSNTVAVIVYTNTAEFLHYPFSYPMTYNDATSGTYSVPMCCNPNTVCNVTVTADGTGTLMLPSSLSNSVNTNCTRIKIETYEQIQVPPGFLYDHIIMYDWYNSTSKFPLMSIWTYTRTYVGASAPPPSYDMRVTVDPNVLAGLNEKNIVMEAIQVFPVPAKDEVHISVGTGKEIARVEVFNLLGQSVKNGKGGTSTVTIETKDLSPGFYILCINSGSAIETRKILVE